MFKFRNPFRNKRDLSDDFLNAVSQRWFGDLDELNRDTQRRIKSASDLAATFTFHVRVQLALCDYTKPKHWGSDRAFILGYVNGLAEMGAKSLGEDSKWPALFIGMTTLCFLLERDFHEEAIFNECSRLTESRDAHFVAGAQSGAEDLAMLLEGKPLLGGIAAMVIERRAL